MAGPSVSLGSGPATLWNAPESVVEEPGSRCKVIDGIRGNKDRRIGPGGFIFGPNGHVRTRKSAPVSPVFAGSASNPVKHRL